MDDQQKQQPLKLRPGAERIAKLRKQHVAIVKASAAAAVEAASKIAPDIGYEMEDGSIFSGLTADGQRIFAMPTDLDVTMTFNDAARRVEELNADKTLGHDDWQIPTLENLRVLYKNQNEGKLAGTFNTASSNGLDYPDWYCSSTEESGRSLYMYCVRFLYDQENRVRRDNVHLSCRPVRLVAAPGL